MINHKTCITHNKLFYENENGDFTLCLPNNYKCFNCLQNNIKY